MHGQANIKPFIYLPLHDTFLVTRKFKFNAKIYQCLDSYTALNVCRPFYDIAGKATSSFKMVLYARLS